MAELVLVYPKTGFDIKGASIELPLSSLSVASVVCKEREVKIIDQRVEESWESRLRKELEKEPLAVGVSSMTGTQIKHALEIAKIVKEYQETALVWGGVHATLLPEQTASHPFVDYVVAGDGEPAMPKLLDAIEKNRSASAVPNMFYKSGKKIEHSRLAVQADLDALPELPFELVDIRNYINNRAMAKEGSKRVLPFITSRGCPYRCAFCCNPVLSNRHWRAMSPKRAFGLVSAMVERFNLDAVTFHDENFFGNPKRAEKLAEMFNNRFSWSVQARMDSLESVNLKMLEKNGLGLVQPGVETGSERIMRFIHKDETVEQILKANRKLAGTGITAVYNFMMGFPTETRDEISMTASLALKLLKENPNATLSGFYVFVPYPGSELYDFAVKEGSFAPPKNLEEWAAYSRMHLNTPWIQDRIPLLKNLMFTSKFVDGKRMTNMLRRFHLPQAVLDVVGGMYRKRWEKKDFRNTLDIKLLYAFSKFYFGWD